MKMKSIEQLRKMELLLFLTANTGQKLVGLELDPTMINIVSSILSLDLLTNYYSIRITEEYQQIDRLYNQAVENMKNLFEALELNNVISIFAAFVTLYRNGYFSHNQQFIYSMNLKDFPLLEGTDVLCGEGVCRSIASLLTDIYSQMGFKSDVLIVQATRQGIDHLQNLNQYKLIKDEKSKKYAQIIEKVTTLIPFPNHLITLVEENGEQYLLDPTNDGFLFYEHFGIIRNANNLDYRMINFSILKQIESIIGVFPIKYSPLKKRKTPPIDDIQYQKKYLYGVRQVMNNPILIEQFYQENEMLYDELYHISNKQNNLIKRMFPIIPNKNNKKEK